MLKSEIIDVHLQEKETEGGFSSLDWGSSSITTNQSLISQDWSGVLMKGMQLVVAMSLTRKLVQAYHERDEVLQGGVGVAWKASDHQLHKEIISVHSWCGQKYSSYSREYEACSHFLIDISLILTLSVNKHWYLQPQLPF